MNEPIYSDRLPSKAVQMQVDGNCLWARCEDGSIWQANHISRGPKWFRFEPPHSPPQPATVVEMPEPLMFLGLVVLECKKDSFGTRGINTPLSLRIAWNDEQRDWLKQALAWCEQEDKP